MAVAKAFKFKTSKAEWWIVGGIALFPILLFYLEGFLRDTFTDDHPFSTIQCIISALYSFSVTFCLYFGTHYIFQWLSHYYPWGRDNHKRLWREIIYVFVFSSIVQFVLLTLFHWLGADFLYELNLLVYLSNILFGLAITFITLAIFEGVYLFQRWRESLLREADLKQAHTKTQLLHLQAQLDPHFMFNSLNVLSALIRKNPSEAEQFVETFAQVYRYVLEVKDEMVVPVKNELAFAKAYLDLQKIRFGEGLQVDVNIQAQDLQKFMLPLALQEVLNNAIKHNEISAEKPLHIAIESDGTALKVTNNLQLRKDPKAGTGTGLANLQKRYSLIAETTPAFSLDHTHYHCTLPLIETDEN
jgi:two-component system LytT family sensor kinase